MSFRMLSFALAFACAAATARADCVDGSRETTAAEREYLIGTLSAIARAMPAAPAGWVVARRTEIDESRFRSMCGQERTEPSLHYSIRYSLVEGREQIDRATETSLAGSMALLTPGEDEKAMMMAASEKMQQLVGIIQKTGGTPTPETERLGREIEEIQAKLEEIGRQRDDKLKEAEARAMEIQRDVEAEIEVSAYSSPHRLFAAEAFDLPGAAAAFWAEPQHDLDGRTFAKAAYVFLGPWTVAKEGAEAVVSPDPAAPASLDKTTRMMLMVTADRPRAEQLVKAVDIKTLNALVQ